MQPTYHNVSINNTENPHSVTGNKKQTCNATLFTNVNKHVITTYKHSKNSIKLTGTHKNTEIKIINVQFYFNSILKLIFKIRLQALKALVKSLTKKNAKNIVNNIIDHFLKQSCSL